jgi:protein Mpv17
VLLTSTVAAFGPAAFKWYSFLQRKVVLGNQTATIVARVLADQTVFTPIHLFCFLSYMSIMEGSSPKEKLRTVFWPTYKANVTLWPAVQLVNFSIIPLEHRVLVVNLVSLGKSLLCFLSLKEFVPAVVPDSDLGGFSLDFCFF